MLHPVAIWLESFGMKRLHPCVEQPWLATLGALDTVVPPDLNEPLFRELLANSARVEIRVNPVLGHGPEHGDRWRMLESGSDDVASRYLKFDRVDVRQVSWPLGFLDETFGLEPIAR